MMSQAIVSPGPVEEAIARGECWQCGECVPWICPNCGEQHCNWFEERCPECGARPARCDYDTSRVCRELAELTRQLERER
jgi:hypothetical protein